ncbi:MAG: N-acetyltransferase [Sphingobacteriaceae bacterium]|nr:MAG: N-acetyltransferase [Sphingobacteriaceae bacterium]
MHNSTETERLFLDTITTRDYEFVISLVNSKGWLQFIGERNVHSQAEAVAYIGKILDSQNFYYWVVRIKEGSIPVGIISFIKQEYLNHFDIVFAFLPQYQGNGYAYEATKEILRVVHAAKKYDPVLATTIPGNVNSVKLLIKLGFHFEKEFEVSEQLLHLYSNA